MASACGYRDSSPVVAEPFSSWVLSGEFPAGRPRWEDAGALFVDDIEPYENRKLWLLNGAHSLLAYAGQVRGHATVAQALADPACRHAVEAFWDEAEANLPAEGLDIPAYRAALLARFGNARIAHHLAQIAMDGTTKLRMRAVPVLRAERAAGRTGAAAALMIAAWLDCTAQLPPAQDPLAAGVEAANALAGTERLRALLDLVDADLAADAAVVDLIGGLTGRVAGPRPPPDTCQNRPSPRIPLAFPSTPEPPQLPSPPERTSCENHCRRSLRDKPLPQLRDPAHHHRGRSDRASATPPSTAANSPSPPTSRSTLRSC